MKHTLKWQHGSRRAWLDGKELNPRRSQLVHNHSPDGFAAGYGGSGPSQLALAILLELLPQDEAADKYHDFKAAVIATIPQADCTVEFELP